MVNFVEGGLNMIKSISFMTSMYQLKVPQSTVSNFNFTIMMPNCAWCLLWTRAQTATDNGSLKFDTVEAVRSPG